MRIAFLLSSATIMTLSFIHGAHAQLYLPNVGECFANAHDRESQQYCEALQNCVNNESDDNASLRGCVDEAQDAYAVADMGILPPLSPLGGGPFYPEFIPSGTEDYNSDLVWGIQGDKGFTNQQEGPND